jgi:hypothetical protein
MTRTNEQTCSIGSQVKENLENRLTKDELETVFEALTYAEIDARELAEDVPSSKAREHYTIQAEKYHKVAKHVNEVLRA